MTTLATVPLERRMETAWRLIREGEDPYEMFWAGLWGEHTAIFEVEPTPIDGSCNYGHPWDETNTYYRPNGRRVCRACARNSKRSYQTRQRIEGGAVNPGTQDGGYPPPSAARTLAPSSVALSDARYSAKRERARRPARCVHDIPMPGGTP